MDWSTDGQTPSFLAATRMVSLNDDVVDAIREAIPLTPGMKVLDAGCGSGEYTFRLASDVADVQFVGFDCDAAFVKCANDRAHNLIGYPFEIPNPQNTYEFIEADGCALPFDDDTFDVVVSHTYLTAIEHWKTALDELVRVCKQGCIVSSVTNMTDDFYGAGNFELLDVADYPDDAELIQRVNALKASVLHGMDTTAGIAPHDVPRAFSAAGLHHVHCRPLAHYFCLSDAHTVPEEAQRHIDLLRMVELEELERISNDPTTAQELGTAQWDRYRDLVEERYRNLQSAIEENREWNWIGNASLLVCGRKPANVAR